MTVNDMTIAKLQKLPKSLISQVNDFIDFLTIRHNSSQWQLWTHFANTTENAESDFADYLSNLEKYEDQLAHGEIKW